MLFRARRTIHLVTNLFGVKESHDLRLSKIEWSGAFAERHNKLYLEQYHNTSVGVSLFKNPFQVNSIAKRAPIRYQQRNKFQSRSASLSSVTTLKQK